MIRRLQPSDFSCVWELALPTIDPRLRPNMKRANGTYMSVLADGSNFAIGEWDKEQLVGVILVTSQHSAYAYKGMGQVQLWIGSLGLLTRAITWWGQRPMMRFLSLQFPVEVRPGLYKYLTRLGFERQGDMNILWRK